MTLAVVRRKLESDHLAILVHRVVRSVQDEHGNENVIISATPDNSKDYFNRVVAYSHAGADLSFLQENMLVWEKSAEVLYSLSGMVREIPAETCCRRVLVMAGGN